MKQAHIVLLRAFDDLPFNIGKKTFVDYLKGNINPTIEKNNLTDLDSYGALYMLNVDELYRLIDALLLENYLGLKVVNGGFQVITRTPQGTKEMFERKFEMKGTSYSHKQQMLFETDQVTQEDQKIFSQFSFFLENYNDEQKKAIISDKSHILCVAGAGSGKTTVLTKRIEFLNQFRSVTQDKILAITFTRKAKQEMESRLEQLNMTQVQVETFNSFSERLLRKFGSHIYEADVRVAEFRDKIALVRTCMEELSFNFEEIVDDYFNKRQLREKSKDDLFFIFINDLFSIIDFYKNRKEEIKPFYEKERHSVKKRIAKGMHDLAKSLQAQLKEKGLRDFSDQILDVLKLFEQHKELIPQYEHILVDEFQDVNLIQSELLTLLNPPNLFVVGDPRQAIYGWRGSDINYIVNYPKEHNAQVLSLSKNYRSRPEIVDLFNKSIISMNLEELESTREKSEEKNLFLIEQDSEQLERIFVADAIKTSILPRNEIFVLARTNKILSQYADFFDQQGITYALKSEEEYKEKEPTDQEITLATVHSIKGMEAQLVFVVSANTLSFPNKVQDNFVLALVKEDQEYEKDDEELRLFYVALSRAKDRLVITYTGNPSKFITDEMMTALDVKPKNKSLFNYASDIRPKNLDSSNPSVLKNMLKDWRTQKSNATSLPTYMIISNTAIDEIIRLMPSSKDDLLNISGLGPAKVAKYGDEIIKLIRG